METIFFLKELRKKGINYLDAWIALLMRFDFKENQKLKINIPFGVPATTYYRIVDYGLKILPDYISTFSITKHRNILKLEIIKNQKQPTLIIEEKKEVEPMPTIVPKIEKQSKPQKEAKLSLEIYEEIIEYLNQCTGQGFKSNSKATQSFINARISEGHTIEDFKKVISIKSSKWLNTKWQDFLRPQTLFSNKFESYLNESIIIEPTKQKQNYDKAIEATELGWNQNS